MKIALRKSVIPNCTSEYWIGTSLFIPTSWSYVKPLNPPADKPLTYHFQVHGGDNEGQAPNLGIREEYGNFTVNVCGSTGPPSNASYSCQYFKIGPITKGRWIDFVIHSKLAFGSPTGFVQVWKDGSLVVDAKNLRTSYNQTNPPYIIAGSYQFNWKENVTNVGYSWTACYHKEVRVGDASSSYDEVNTGSNPLTTPTPTISPSFRPKRAATFVPSACPTISIMNAMVVFPIETSSSLSNVSFSSISVLFVSVFSNVSLLPSSLVSLTSFDHVTSASSTSLAKTASKIRLSSSSYSYSVSLSLYYDDRVVSWQERGLEVFEEEVRRNMSQAFRSGKVRQLIISTSKKMNVDGLDGMVVGNYSMVLSVLQPSSSPTPSIGSSSDGSTLSEGAVIGISVGGAAVLVFVLFVFAVWNKSHKSSQYTNSPVEDVELGKSAGSVVVVLEEDPEFAQMQSNNDEIKL